jgi:hypothetical protein
MTLILSGDTESSSEAYRPVPKFFDLEGVILLPAVDLAWMMIRSVSGNIREMFPDKRVEEFDTWDDEAWLYEHHFLKKEDGKIIWDVEGLREFFYASPIQKFVGHSTGTTPIIADFIAACDGMDDKKLMEFVGVENYIKGQGKTIIQESPGIDQLLKYAMENGGAYIITNSHPVMSLAVAYKYGISSSHVVAHGNQLSEEKLRYFDSRRGKEFDRKLFEEELSERSPLNLLSIYRDELESLTDRIISNCKESLEAIQKKDEERIKDLIKSRHLLFTEVVNEELYRQTTYLFEDEIGITGGHNKVWPMRRISPDGNCVFLDDSIVGADGLAFVRYGFATNNTDVYGLHSCSDNFIAHDFSKLVPVCQEIDNGRFYFEKVSGRYSGLVAFTPAYIKENFDAVKAANKTMKGDLKTLYKS